MKKKIFFAYEKNTNKSEKMTTKCPTDKTKKKKIFFLFCYYFLTNNQ